MAIIVSVASGKGGVGKSVVASNLALLLARRGKQVVLADLDVGGANLHVLFGLFHPSRTLTDFLAKRVETLDAVAQSLDAHPGLRLLPGTGETLATANMPFAKKKRLIRHLKELPADIVVVDVGTSVLDLYRFIKLAAIRRVLSAFLARDEIAEVLSDRDFASVEEVLEAAGKTSDEGRGQAADMLQGFRPYLILNRMSGRSRVNTLQLKNLLQSYVGGDLAMLGEIPEDEAVERSVRRYLPVVDHAPQSPAAEAFNRLTDALLLELREKSSP
jgi:flagellar biosynthesis protein FlhG